MSGSRAVVQLCPPRTRGLDTIHAVRVADSQNDAFASTSTFLGGTFRRMNKMAKRQGGNWCWFMGFLLLVLWIFVVVWWLRR